MDRDEIINIISVRYRKLKKHSKKIVQQFNEEEIHQLRVEYKKLRAFLRMLSNDFEGTGELKISKKLKKSYRIAGAIRDLQLQRQRIKDGIEKEDGEPKKYLNLLQKEIKRIRPELAESFSENPIKESRKNTTDSIPSKFTFTSFNEFAQKKWMNILAIITSANYTDDNIHAIRKSLKDLFYNLKMYKASGDELFMPGTLQGKEQPYFDQLLEQLGNFQDKCTAIALLKSFWLSKSNVYEYELLQRIKSDWIKEKGKMKKMLKQKLEIEFTPKETKLSIQPPSPNSRI